MERAIKKSAERMVLVPSLSDYVRKNSRSSSTMMINFITQSGSTHSIKLKIKLMK